MGKTGLFIVSKPNRIRLFLPAIQEHVQKTLYVQFFPGRNCLLPRLQPKTDSFLSPPHHRQTVINIYSQTTVPGHNLDVRVLLSGFRDPLASAINTKKEIEVILFDNKYNTDEVNHFVESYIKNIRKGCQIVTLDDSHISHKDHASTDTGNFYVKTSQHNIMNNKTLKMYNSVVLGGTFDRLHVGHKMLLSEAVLHCTEKITVGVTDTPMLKSKKLWELIEPCSQRIQTVRDFLVDVEPNLEYDVVPIIDPFGPTKHDPTFQMLVVSAETYKGGLKVNDVRRENGLPQLEIHTVDLLQPLFGVTNAEEEEKISSSNERMKLLGSRIQPAEKNTNIPDRPYTIGLTGPIASGKTSIAKRLSDLGAGIISCDPIAHELYRKGGPCYAQLRQLFGDIILDSQGEVDRKILGSLVFSDKVKLQTLNNLLWPVMLQIVKERAQEMYQEGKEAVIVEAAVLLQAGWDKHCHEVWACIIPAEEAVERLKKRNNLSENDAKARIANQISNTEYVAKSNVVFSTLWSPEFTQSQVEKAWCLLQQHLYSKSQ